MSKYKLAYTARFIKSYKKLHPNEKNQIMKKTELLSQNPMHPSLRTKKIQGNDNIFECSMNMDIRIIWYYEDEYLIILLDVGHHDVLRRF
ncbi:MAG: type II toxin-antitoxin system YafQ family toxin [Alkaliphilus sp.]